MTDFTGENHLPKSGRELVDQLLVSTMGRGLKVVTHWKVFFSKVAFESTFWKVNFGKWVMSHWKVCIESF